MAKKHKQTTAMQIFIGIILAVALVGLANLGINAFYPAPEYNTYCTAFAPTPVPKEPPTNCQYIASVSEEEQVCYQRGGYPEYSYTQDGCIKEMTGCNMCNTTFDQANKDYHNTIFYILLIIGLILAVTGLFIGPVMFQVAGIGAGSSLIIEAIFRNLDNRIMAFIAGLIIVIILGYVAWKKFGAKKR